VEHDRLVRRGEKLRRLIGRSSCLKTKRPTGNGRAFSFEKISSARREGVADIRKDAGGFDFDFAFHPEDFEENFHALLRREDLGNQRAESSEWAIYHLHFLTDLDRGRDFDRFLIYDCGAQLGHDIIGHDRWNSAEAHDGGYAMGACDMAVLGAVVEFGEDIAGEHRLSDLHLAAAADALEAEHRAENLDADIPHEHTARGGFIAGLGLHAEPMEFLVFKMGHGRNVLDEFATGKRGETLR
jgi:hypothetical protein